ncbi:MAG: sulfite exporter TauE/SafE family protein [Marinilabiliales bacterium]|nr:sulfite exporter TauE/SafE family protein [Marinilabiliales bacterium]
MEWYMFLAVIAAGLFAGFVNTLAGSGSLITLPLLMFLGLPANVANGTNRIGVLRAERRQQPAASRGRNSTPSGKSCGWPFRPWQAPCWDHSLAIRINERIMELTDRRPAHLHVLHHTVQA